MAETTPIAVAAGISTAFGGISFIASLYFHAITSRKERSIREIVDDDSIPPEQIIEILKQFETDEARLKALEKLLHDRKRASLVYDKIRGEIDIESLVKSQNSYYSKFSTAFGGIFVVLAFLLFGVHFVNSRSAFAAHPTTTNSIAPADLPNVTQTVLVSARVADWQSTGITLQPGEWAKIGTFTASETNGWWIFGHNSPRGYSGANGYGVPAGPNYKLRGAPEGCLLMRLGDGSVTYWDKPAATKIVNTPGTISFMANDDMTHQADRFVGYEDNDGRILVEIVISKTSPIDSPNPKSSEQTQQLITNQSLQKHEVPIVQTSSISDHVKDLQPTSNSQEAPEGTPVKILPASEINGGAKAGAVGARTPASITVAPVFSDALLRRACHVEVSEGPTKERDESLRSLTVQNGIATFTIRTTTVENGIAHDSSVFYQVPISVLSDALYDDSGAYLTVICPAGTVKFVGSEIAMTDKIYIPIVSDTDTKDKVIAYIRQLAR